MIIPANIQFIETFEKVQLYSDEIKALPSKPGIEEMKKRVTDELEILSGIISEGFNLPELYNSPDYKKRILFAQTKIVAEMSGAFVFKQLLDKQQFEYLLKKSTDILLPVINVDLPY